jgi:hypothetical protein
MKAPLSLPQTSWCLGSLVSNTPTYRPVPYTELTSSPSGSWPSLRWSRNPQPSKKSEGSFTITRTRYRSLTWHTSSYPTSV